MGLPSPINIQVEGNDLPVSHDIAQKLVDKSKTIPGAADVRIQERLDYPQIRIDLDRPKIARIGLTVEEVVKSIVTALNSSINFAPAFWIDPKNGNHYFLGAQYPETLIKDLDTLRNIGITGKNQERVVRLREIAAFKEITAPSEIRHLNIKRVIDIFANVQGRDAGGVAGDIQAILPKPQDLPEGYRGQMRGEIASMRDAFKNLGFGLLLAVVLVQLVLSGQFRSFADPLLILCAVPVGLIGVLVTLWATHTTLNVQSFIGIIFMVGIAVSNSILLVEFANRELEQGQKPDDAIVRAAGIRLRPILMTSLATLLGLAPMAIGIGHGAEANVPLARAVLGGILVSTILTLVIVPMLYAALQRLKKGHPSALICFLLSLLLLPGKVEATDPVALSYEKAVELALHYNPRIRAAEARIEESRQDIRTARASAYPRLTLSAIDSDGLGGSSSALGITGLVNSPYRKGPAAGVDGAWTLYDFGRTSYKTAAAQEKVKATQAGLEKVKLETRLEVADAFFRCAQYERLNTVLEVQVQDQGQIIHEVGRYVRSGLRSPVEWNLVRATSQGIQARQEDVRTQKLLATEELRGGMSAPELGSFQCQADTASLTPTLSLQGRGRKGEGWLLSADTIDKLIASRPAIIVARQQVQAAEAEWKAARREQGPILSAVGSAGRLDETIRVQKKEWSAGVGIRLHLFEGFRLSAAEKRSARALEEARSLLAVREQAIRKEIRSDLALVRGLGEKRKHLEEQQKLVDEAYHMARRRYLEKTGTFTDLRDAQAMYFQTVEQTLAAEFAERLAVERLRIQSGS